MEKKASEKTKRKKRRTKKQNPAPNIFIFPVVVHTSAQPKMNPDETCMICQDKAAAIMMLPCEHVVSCAACFQQWQQTQAPNARKCLRCQRPVKEAYGDLTGNLLQPVSVCRSYNIVVDDVVQFTQQFEAALMSQYYRMAN